MESAASPETNLREFLLQTGDQLYKDRKKVFTPSYTIRLISKSPSQASASPCKSHAKILST